MPAKKAKKSSKKTTKKSAAKKTSPKKSAHSIIVYSTPQCPYCHMAKEFLKEKGFAYSDINVAADAKAAADMIEKSGQRGVPVIDIDGKIIIGFDKRAIEEALGI